MDSDKENLVKFPCPVCGVSRESDSAGCKSCGWEDLPVPQIQEDHPGLEAGENQSQANKHTRTQRAFGIGCIPVWAMFVLPSVWHLWFPETAGWDWKQMLVGALLAPAVHVLGASIGASIAQRYNWWTAGAVLLVIVFASMSLIRTSAPRRSSLDYPQNETPAVWTSAFELSDEECIAFAKSIENAVASGNLAAFNDKFEWNALIVKASTGVPLPAKLQQGVLREIRNFGQQIIDLTRPAGSYKVLRIRTKGTEKWALFRMLFPDGAVNYHDLLLAQDANGKLKVIDIYVFNGGILMSESFRRVTLPMLAHEDEELLEYLTESEREYSAHAKTFAQIVQAFSRGDYRTALQLYDKLPPSLQRDKTILSWRVRAAQPLGGEQYSRVLADYRAYYPDDPSLDLLLIDLYGMTKEYDKVLLSIDRIVEATGGDSYLNALKAAVFYDQKELDAAKKEAQKAIDEDPTIEQAYSILIRISLDRKQFDETVELLKAIRRELHGDFEFYHLAPIPGGDEFVKSPEYREWLSSRW